MNFQKFMELKDLINSHAYGYNLVDCMNITEFPQYQLYSLNLNHHSYI